MRINRPAPNNTLPAVVEGEYLPAADHYTPTAYRPLPSIAESELSEQLRDEIKRAELYAASGYFGSRVTEECFARMKLGQELGIGEVVALRELYSVHGRLAPSALLMGALIKRAGRYNYRLKELTLQSATISFFEHGALVGESVFTLEDAQRAKLLSRGQAGRAGNWELYPKAMLFARALAQGARIYCADAILGLEYLASELGADVVESVVE